MSTTMSFAAARRLVDELTKITVNPELHDQVVWTEAEKDPNKTPESECGTVGCLAGNAVITAKFPLIWQEVENYNTDTDRYEVKWRAHDCKVDGVIETIENAARNLFELTHSEARDLFDQDNSLTDLWEKAIEYGNRWIGVTDVVNAFQRRVAKVKSESVKALSEALEKL